MNKNTEILPKSGIYVESIIPEKIKQGHNLLFVHGSFGGAWMWMNYLPYFAEQGWPAYALTLRGHKGSKGADLARVRMEDYMEDVFDVVSEKKFNNVIVVGHSMGGLVSMMAGHGNPESGITGVVNMDGSPTKEVQGGSESEEVINNIPDVYTATDAGMPEDIEEVVKQLPDIPKEKLMKIKEMLGPESGNARRERKRGISIPKEEWRLPMLCIGAGKGDSVKFGISPEVAKKSAEYYGAKFLMVPGATHPGVLIGENWRRAAEKIEEWVTNIETSKSY